mgnify:CR=1 FL=1
MSWKCDQTAVEPEIIRELGNTVIVPLLGKYAEELGQKMITVLSVRLYDDEISHLQMDERGFAVEDSSVPLGEIRVWFRRTFGIGRCMYYVEALYPDLPQAYGWTGFSLSGRIHLMESGRVRPPETIVNRYNQCRWRGPVGL